MELRRTAIAMTALLACTSLQAAQPQVETLETAVCADVSVPYVFNRSKTGDPSFV